MSVPLATWKRAGRIALFALAGALVFGVVATLPWRWIDPPTTAFILERGAAATPRRWVSLDEMTPYLPMAVIAAEDQKFATHRGFDLESIRETLDAAGAPRRGASTITQQLAKNLYLWPGRSWVRKGLEAYFTVYIEAFWPKRRILEVYLNVAEFGPGIFGAAAACQAHFGVEPRALAPYEAALLAAGLPNPRRFSARKPSPYVASRAIWILEQMEQLGGEDYLARL